jgi:hypothetical protein
VPPDDVPPDVPEDDEPGVFFLDFFGAVTEPPVVGVTTGAG